MTCSKDDVVHWNPLLLENEGNRSKLAQLN